MFMICGLDFSNCLFSLVTFVAEHTPGLLSYLPLILSLILSLMVVGMIRLMGFLKIVH